MEVPTCICLRADGIHAMRRGVWILVCASHSVSRRQIILSEGLFRLTAEPVVFAT